VSIAVKKITTGYEPRALQAELHMRLKRFSVLVMHRRFGKTVFAINHMVDSGLRNARKNPRYAYIAPLYGQAKRVAWDYLKQYALCIPGATANEADLRVDIPRPALGDSIRFTLLGADNPASLKGIYLDGVVLDEYADMNPTIWGEVIRPTLSDRIGWAIFIGTPKGQNAFYTLYNRALAGTESEWFSAMYKASETKIISKAELDSARAEMTEDEYDQEFECSFQAGITGAYFSKEMTNAEKEKRITHVPHEPSLPTDTYWDLGMNDVTSIWGIQSTRFEHRAIFYLEAPDTGIPEWIRILKNKGWLLGKFYLPHDAKVRDMGTGKSRLEAFHSVGIRPIVIPRVEDKLDSIHAARMIIPKVWFDRIACKRGLEALMNYQRKWDAKAMVFSPKPAHTWASNAADAFQQFAMGVKEDRSSSTRTMPRMAQNSYDVFNS
jgi:phage terminase large subunit